MQESSRAGGETRMALNPRSDALCARLPASVADELFFPDQMNPRAVERARALCDACPIKALCATLPEPVEARTGYRFGIWGGTTPGERERGVPVCGECGTPTDGLVCLAHVGVAA
ncbi:WhiB family transcriptional regulator [Sediminivirga luteola]